MADELDERMPWCRTCGMRKHPIGRDPGPAAANGYCGVDCPGYFEEPRASNLWPGENPKGDDEP